MLFNSYEFLVFLPIVFLLYWFVFRGRQWQNLLIVVASYIFYGWWDWRFLFLIALTSFCSYGSGMLLEYYEGQRRKQKLVSASNIVLNLGILGVFNLIVLAKMPTHVEKKQSLEYLTSSKRIRFLTTRSRLIIFAYGGLKPVLIVQSSPVRK